MTEQAENKNTLSWKAETEHPDLCKSLKEGLRSITDPELVLDIIQLGLVRDVMIEPEQAVIKMILTTPFCPFGPSMLETTRAKAEQILNRPTRIDFGLEPWDFSMMEDGVIPNWGI